MALGYHMSQSRLQVYFITHILKQTSHKKHFSYSFRSKWDHYFCCVHI